MLITSLYKIQSSANKCSWDDTFSWMSLMNTTNKRGPRTVPWGTSELTMTSSDLIPSRTTRWVRLVTKHVSQSRMGPWTPKFLSLRSKRWCGTLSKALLKSVRIRSTCRLLSRVFVRFSKRKNSWVSQLLPFLKPCWASDRMALASRCVIKWW